MDRHIVTTTIDWHGIAVSVSFEPAYLGLTWNSHLQVQSVTPERAPLPMTETGYRSYFCHPAEIAAAGGPVAYVLAWLEQDAKSKQWQEFQSNNRQMSLF